MGNTIRFFFVVTAALCGICVAAPAAALDLAVTGAYWKAADSDEEAWGSGGKIGVPLLSDHLRLEARASWLGTEAGGEFDHVELIPVDLGGSVHFRPKGRLDPYLVGGASYVFADSDRGELDDDWGAYAGVGLDLRLGGPLYLTTEALFRFVQLPTQNGSSSDEWDANGLAVNAGLLMRF
jgi:hypothetical protein